MIKTLISTVVITAVCTLACVSTVYAADPTPTPATGTICQPLYGGGQICPQVDNILLDKKVANPSTSEFVDNLGPTDPAYQANQPIFFKVTITNKSTQTVSGITVKDIFPQYVSYVSGGNGKYDKNSKTLTISIDKLGVNESKTFNLTGITSSASQLPQDQPGMCMGNQSQAQFNGKTAQDNAQFCILRQEYSGQKGGSFPSSTDTNKGGTNTPQTQPGENKGGIVVPTQAPITKGGVLEVQATKGGIVEVPQTTKGGMPVYQPGPVQTTPPTGPEALPLLGLIPAAIAGFALRKKSL